MWKRGAASARRSAAFSLKASLNSGPQLRASPASRYSVTVHIAIGTDIIHMHPDASGSALEKAVCAISSPLAANITRLENGVYLNCGSAVILPEVFLKAVAIARNGIALANLTTSTWIDSSVPDETDVVQRTTAPAGHGYC